MFLSFIFLRLVNPMLPGSLDCPILMAPSVFSDVFMVIMKKETNIACTSRYVSLVNVFAESLRTISKSVKEIKENEI